MRCVTFAAVYPARRLTSTSSVLDGVQVHRLAASGELRSQMFLGGMPTLLQRLDVDVRLGTEPRPLGWRYLSTNTAFAFLALRRVIGG